MARFCNYFCLRDGLGGELPVGEECHRNRPPYGAAKRCLKQGIWSRLRLAAARQVFNLLRELLDFFRFLD
jgi:hypothetical protein